MQRSGGKTFIHNFIRKYFMFKRDIKKKTFLFIHLYTWFPQIEL